jgi:hypothetical protein
VRSGGELLILLLGTPVDEVGSVESDAKEIGGYKTELGSADANYANDGTVDGGDNPALPQLLAEENGAEDGQNAGEIIESNHMKSVTHVGSMSLYRSLLQPSNGLLGVPVLRTCKTVFYIR